MRWVNRIRARVTGKSPWEILSKTPGYVRKTILLRALGFYYKRKLHASAGAQAERRQIAFERLAEAETVLFLCHGNICRGPFAERYARHQLESAGLTSITVDSAGFCELTDPTSPPDARKIAEKHGIDLETHQAVQADAASINRADLILLMDYRNYHNFTNRFPDAADRMFLLRLFGDGEQTRIADPHGAGPEAFEIAYDEIRSSVDELISARESAQSANTCTQIDQNGIN